jgi:uncharacterized protein with PIN domain
MEPRFIVDINAGKLAKWLRIIGYDALLFTNEDDGKMIKTAVNENRVILTRDSQIMKRRLITSGKLKAILVQGDELKTQLKQITNVLNLDYQFRPFTICLECNHNLIVRNKEEVSNRVPPHVFETQSQYMECPSCHRIFWRGTHWQAMMKELESIMAQSQKQSKAV